MVYGVLLNLSFWPFVLSGDTSIAFVPGDPVLDNLGRFVVFSLLTSLGFDLPRAVVTTLLVLVTGPALLRSLRRAARRASFAAPVTFIGHETEPGRSVSPGPAQSGIGDPDRPDHAPRSAARRAFAAMASRTHSASPGSIDS